MPRTDLVVIVPSRGRPGNVRRLLDAAAETMGAIAELWIAVDADDPAIDGYRALVDEQQSWWKLLILEQRQRLAGTINLLACGVAISDFDAVAFMGDDVLPRTKGWDVRIVDALAGLGSGIVYGDDLLQGERLPTAVFMSTDIVRALGWMCPPGLVHLYLDNAWLELGRAMGRLRYLPDVVLEHLHPDAGKAPQDATYREANSRERDSADRAAYEAWRRDRLPLDLEVLRAAGVCP